MESFGSNRFESLHTMAQQIKVLYSRGDIEELNKFLGIEERQ